jgi:predicted nucleic acid-binding protein
MAALVQVHPAHDVAVRRLQQIKHGDDTGVVSAHTLAELYSNLTRLPVKPIISPTVAQQLIKQNIVGTFEIVSLSAQDYVAVIDHLVANNIIGGVIYDALIARAAIQAKVDQLVTLNARDFRRVYPDMAGKIVTP